MRKLQQRAREVGLDFDGPYFRDVYSLRERSSGVLLADRLTPDEIRAEVEKHAGVARLADARRRRSLSG